MPVATRWSKPLVMCGAGCMGPLRERVSGAGLLGSLAPVEVVSTVISSATSTCQAPVCQPGSVTRWHCPVTLQAQDSHEG